MDGVLQIRDLGLRDTKSNQLELKPPVLLRRDLKPQPHGEARAYRVGELDSASHHTRPRGRIDAGDARVASIREPSRRRRSYGEVVQKLGVEIRGRHREENHERVKRKP